VIAVSLSFLVCVSFLCVFLVLLREALAWDKNVGAIRVLLVLLREARASDKSVGAIRKEEL
jgi:hypothetical protein